MLTPNLFGAKPDKSPAGTAQLSAFARRSTKLSQSQQNHNSQSEKLPSPTDLTQGSTCGSPRFSVGYLSELG
jgi:hypothetical protein